MNKIFKFWKWRFEIKLSKVKDSKKAEFLAKELIKTMNVDLQENCNCVRIWTHNINGKISGAVELDTDRIDFEY